jgi:hypothetical protein
LLRQAMTESPITGDTGNREFFLHLRQESRERRGTHASGWSGAGGPRD